MELPVELNRVFIWIYVLPTIIFPLGFDTVLHTRAEWDCHLIYMYYYCYLSQLFFPPSSFELNCLYLCRCRRSCLPAAAAAESQGYRVLKEVRTLRIFYVKCRCNVVALCARFKHFWRSVLLSCRNKKTLLEETRGVFKEANGHLLPALLHTTSPTNLCHLQTPLPAAEFTVMLYL